MRQQTRRILSAAVVVALSQVVRAADVSAPVIVQYFESKWSTMERRSPDVFMAGYGSVWTPPPGRALYVDQGGGIGYDLYDRFDLGKANDPTLYGTEKGYRTFVNAMHQQNGDVYLDYVHHHVGTFDVPGFTGNPGSPTVQTTRDYPGFELSDPYQNNRDSYSDAPPAPGSGDFNSAYQYQFRLSHLITIDLTNQNNRFFVRNPVPGFGNNIPQSSANYAIQTSTLLPNGQVGPSTINRQANTPTEDNRRFYPDNSLPGITVTDPATGGGTYTIHPFNTANPSAGDPSAEDPAGYMMRYAQWLVNDIGVDGLRIDAARHVPRGIGGDPYNPQQVNIPALVDRAVYRQSTRTNLDGSQRQVFSFQEVFTGDKGFNQTFIRKDINPNTPNVVGGNRDVLDFPMWFAMRANFTGDGTHNNWYNVRNASQDIQDDGLANNGSQSIGFVVNHDDGRGDINNQNNDYIVLDNVAHAWILTRPGNAYVYFNSHEFDRSNNSSFFLKDGRGDALGGQYGNTITNLVDIRSSYGRGNFQERWIDGGGSSAVYAFERMGSMVVGLNVGYNPGSTSRTINTSFAAGTHLIELTGNWQDPSGTIPQVITVNGSGQATLNIPWNNAANGNKGYVMYGLPRPQGSVSLSNVSQTIAPDASGSNATKRLTAIDVVTANTFNVTLNTAKVILPDSYHDQPADGDRAYVRIDGGMDLNGNAAVDFTSQGDTRYGFENFVTANSPGYVAASGNGNYVQSINAANLSEGYHYITARAYRQRSDGGPDIFTDFKKVVYIDRLPPSTSIDGIAQSGSGAGKSVSVTARSLDLTADNVHVLMDLGAALTDAQVLALLNSGTQGTQSDRDLFVRTVSGVANGVHATTVVTREVTGNYSILRATGLGTAGGLGLGFGDLNASGTVTASDITQFQTVLQSSNQQFHAAAEANTDGLVNLADAFLLGPRLTVVGADAATLNAYSSMINAAYVTTGTYTVNANHTVYNVTAGTTNVLSGNTLSARSIGGGALSIANAARVNMQSRTSGGATSKVNTLSITGSGKLDLSDSSMIIQSAVLGSWNGSVYTGIQGLVASGLNGGGWDGSGIITSQTDALTGLTTIGVSTGALIRSLGPTDTDTWAGQTINGNSTVAMYTYAGDADLNGLIDGNDYGYIDFGIAVPGTDGYGNGDFNYDGVIDGNDYGTIDFNILTQGAPFFASGEIGDGAELLAGVAAVPEPASLSVIGLGAAALMGRRRRGK